MSAGPTVSIVIPAFNHAGYLREAIDSVLLQDYPVELIVLDDGSTDETQSVLRSYPAGAFHWESHANLGQARTLNKGWQMAQGEILSYLSADDALAPGAVSAAVKILQAGPNVVATYSDFKLISHTSHVFRRVRTPDYDFLRLGVQMVCLPGPGAFFRRSGLEAAGGWNPAYRQMPDLDFWLRLNLCGPFQRIPESLAFFRVHDASQTFALATPERANEPRLIAREYLARADLPAEVQTRRSQVICHSHLLSAQLHAEAGRWHTALRSLGTAAWHSPWSAARLSTLRIAVRACLHRRIYSLWQRWATRPRVAPAALSGPHQVSPGRPVERTR